MDSKESNAGGNKGDDAGSSTTIKFKKIKKKPLRSKLDCIGQEEDANSDGDNGMNKLEKDKLTEGGEEEEDEWSKLEEMKLLRSIKRRNNKGINASDLLSLTTKESKSVKEKAANIGGLMTSLDLANTFSVETNRRDEDQDMLKFIEEQLARKKGIIKEEDREDRKKQIVDDDDVIFNILPEHLLKTGQKKNEEMLSNQMLSGIPEVDLGIEERIRNIEATEEAKMKLLEGRGKRTYQNSSSTLVPTNIAANYVQHNRFSVDDAAPSAVQNKKPKIVKPVTMVVKEPVVVIGDEPKQGYFRTNSGQNRSKLKFPGKEKATDDYHFEKFKKQYRCK